MGRLGGVLGLVAAACLALSASAFARPAFLPPGKDFGFNATLVPVDETPGIISERTLDAAEAAGAGHMRIGIVWRLYENETSNEAVFPPSFRTPVGQPTANAQTNRADQQYLGIVNRGMTPIILVHSAPYWASTFHTCLTNPVHRLDTKRCPSDWRTNAKVLYTAPDRFAALWKFAAAVAERYPEAIIEGTNEPDYQHYSQLRYHPPIETVADAQCVLAGGVRSVDPDRQILTSGLYLMKYAEPYLKRLSNRDCFDQFSTHIGGSSEVRAGFGSGVSARMQEIRYLLSKYPGPSKRVYITETGLSDTFTLHDGRDLMGEGLVATAFPWWVEDIVNEPDVDGILVHTIREGAAGETGPSFGYGNLKKDYTVKPAGPGTIPRFCWMVLQNASTWPGCEGFSLPSDDPQPPHWYMVPELQWPDDPQGDMVARVLFLDRGVPRPQVAIAWQRCNGLGLGCLTVLRDTTGYKVTSADRGKRVKAVITISNAHGTVTRETELGPLHL